MTDPDVRPMIRLWNNIPPRDDTEGDSADDPTVDRYKAPGQPGEGFRVTRGPREPRRRRSITGHNPDEPTATP